MWGCWCCLGANPGADVIVVGGDGVGGCGCAVM